MKAIISVVIVLLIGGKSLAQLAPDNVQLAAKVAKYQKMKTGGATLAVIGAIFFVSGVITTHNNPPELFGDQGTWAGPGLTLIGVAGLGAGIPLWTVGAHQQRKYKAQLQKISLEPAVGRHVSGIGLRFQF